MSPPLLISLRKLKQAKKNHFTAPIKYVSSLSTCLQTCKGDMLHLCTGDQLLLPCLGLGFCNELSLLHHHFSLLVWNNFKQHTFMLWSFPSFNKTPSHLQISLQLLLNFSLWENISKGLPCFSVSTPSYSIFSLIDFSQVLTHSFPQTTLIRSRLAVNCLPQPMVSSPFILFIATSDTSDHYTFPDTFLLDFHDIHSTVKQNV